MSRLCPPDQYYNPKTHQCVSKTGKVAGWLLSQVQAGIYTMDDINIGKCPPGYVWNSKTNRCNKGFDASKNIPQIQTGGGSGKCKDDEFYNPISKRCIKKTGRAAAQLLALVNAGKLNMNQITNVNCPPNNYFNQTTERCVKNPTIYTLQPVQQPIQPVQQPIQPVQQTIQPVQQPIQPVQMTQVQQPIQPVQQIQRISPQRISPQRISPQRISPQQLSPCSPREYFNPQTNRCVARTGIAATKLLSLVQSGKLKMEDITHKKCPPGYIWNNKTKRCNKISTKTTKVPRFASKAPRIYTQYKPSQFIPKRYMTSNIRPIQSQPITDQFGLLNLSPTPSSRISQQKPTLGKSPTLPLRANLGLLNFSPNENQNQYPETNLLQQSPTQFSSPKANVPQYVSPPVFAEQKQLSFNQPLQPLVLKPSSPKQGLLTKIGASLGLISSQKKNEDLQPLLKQQSPEEEELTYDMF